MNAMKQCPGVMPEHLGVGALDEANVVININLIEFSELPFVGGEIRTVRWRGCG